MTTASEGSLHARRGRLTAAASEAALGTLALDSIEVAVAAIDLLGRTEVPGEVLDGLRGATAGAGDPAQAPEAALLIEIVRPYLPDDEPEDRDDRAMLLEFAAVVIDEALVAGDDPRERAKDAAWVLADLHSHLDARGGIRMTPGEEPYDDFCLRRQNDLLEASDPAAARESTALGVRVLEQGLRSLLEAGQL